MAFNWPPSRKIPPSEDLGPYPRDELEKARSVLVNLLSIPQGDLLESIKPKLGIDSVYGPGYVPTPMPSMPPVQVGPPIQYRPDHLPRYQRAWNGRSIPVATVTRSASESSGIHEHWEVSSHGSIERGQGDSRASPASSVIPVQSSVSSGNLKAVTRLTHGAFNLISIPREENSVETNNHQVPISLDESDSVSSETESNMSRKRRRYDDGDHEEYNSKRWKDEKEEIFKTYKCDFCPFNSKEFHSMKTHLAGAKHFSGSLYNAKLSPKLTLVSIDRMLAVKNQYNSNAALVVSCPECRDIFEDIFMCGIHYKYSHGSTNGFYSICPVVYHKTVTINTRPTCSTCKTTFSRFAELHKHWNSKPEHRPFCEPSNEQVFMLTICPYCRRMFYGNFYQCEAHVLNHESPNDKRAVEIKHVMLPRKKDMLPPFNTADGHADGINGELTVLRKMRTFFKNVAHNKAKILEIRNRIKHLSSLAAGMGIDLNCEDGD